MNWKKWVAVVLAALLMLAGVLWVIDKVRQAPLALAQGLSQAVGEKLHANPRVVIRRTVVVEEKKPIAELAVVSRTTDVEQRMISEQYFSEARLSMRATFNVKAGFDLRSRDFLLELDPDGKHARLELTAPRVLSLELTQYQVLEDKGGWWHKFSESQREMAFRHLQAQAKLEAIRAGILEDCKLEIQKWLASVPSRFGLELEFAYKRAGDPSVVPWRPFSSPPPAM